MIYDAEGNDQPINIPQLKTAVSSFEQIQERFFAVRDLHESLFMNDSATFDY